MLAPIHGTCDAAFHAVREAFSNNFLEHGEIGASVCITVNGVTVVDLWGGYSEPSKTSLWQEDQLVNAFSIGKGVTAVVAAQKSNLFFGTALLSDRNEVKVLDMADLDGSQNVRIIMRYTAGVAFGFGPDIVYQVSRN